MSLAEAVYRLTKQFPKDELFGLTSQMRRASVSIPANIAEGYGRESTGAYVQFLRIAQGSLKELETHALLANRVGIMSELDAANLLSLAESIGKMLRALIRSLEK
ncbi:four helix bundle protein [Bosea sp. OK403]|nr:four helix bundle protein [Bosea sp. OK403]